VAASLEKQQLGGFWFWLGKEQQTHRWLLEQTPTEALGNNWPTGKWWTYRRSLPLPSWSIEWPTTPHTWASLSLRARLWKFRPPILASWL